MRTPAEISADAESPAAPERRRALRRGFAARRWTVYVTIALSGAAALGAEVVWTRLMAMLLLATVYVFSIILAVFLIGLAVGQAARPPG